MTAIEIAKEYLKHSDELLPMDDECICMAQAVIEQDSQIERCKNVLTRLVKGFDQDIATTPNSFAAKDCRDVLIELDKETGE